MRHRPPELCHERLLHQPGLAQVELFTNRGKYENKVYVLPKHLDEKIARVHVEALGAHLTTLRKDQAEYINVSVDGPYKSDHYRY